MIFNVHLPQSTSFALPYRASDSFPILKSRIADKAALPSGVSIGSDPTGYRLQYTYKSSLFALDDQDDFDILQSRFSDSTDEPDIHLIPPPSPRSSAPSEPSLPSDSPQTQTKTQTKTHRRLPDLSAMMPLKKERPGSVPSPIPAPLVTPRPDSPGSKGMTTRLLGGKLLGSEKAKGEIKLKHQQEFDTFHGNNGVRTVLGSIGPVQNVRMLLKAGYRHVYISRAFAQKNGFIPNDAAPGFYGYGGLVNLGQWPVKVGSVTQKHTIMLSEESHFSVVLGRSWMEKMGVKTDPLDPTSVTLMGGNKDGGEKVGCDLVVIKDGRGEVVTIT